MKSIYAFASVCVLGVLSGCSSTTPEEPVQSDSARVEVAVTRGELVKLPPECSTAGDHYSVDGGYTFCMFKTAEPLHFVIGDRATDANLMTDCQMTLSWRSNVTGAAWKTLHAVDCFSPPDTLGPADVAFENVPGDAQVTGVRDLVSGFFLGSYVLPSSSVDEPTSSEGFAPPLIQPADVRVQDILDLFPKECVPHLKQFLDKLGADAIYRQRLKQAQDRLKAAQARQPQNPAEIKELQDEIKKLEDNLKRVSAEAEQIACKLVKCIIGDWESLSALLEWIAKEIGFPMPKCEDGKPVGGAAPPPPVQLPPGGGIKFVPVEKKE